VITEKRMSGTAPGLAEAAPTPPVGPYVAYAGDLFRVGAIHLSGVVRHDGLEVRAHSVQGAAIAARLPAAPPASEVVEDEDRRLRRASPLSIVRVLCDEARGAGLHFLGILSYEAAHLQEDLPPPADPFLEFQICECAATTGPWPPPPPADVRAPAPPCGLVGDTSGRFAESFARSREHLLAGDLYEIVLSRRWTFATDHAAMRDFMARTMDGRRALYRFVLDFPRTCVVGASPELLVRVDGDAVTTRPISGSMRRDGSGAALTPGELETFEELLRSEKEKSELDMLVDLARHDLHRVCDDVHLEGYREALVLETVVHTQTTVKGTLKPGRDALDALFSCLNAGTLVGAPKRMAMEVLARLEDGPRRYYGGNLVHVLPSGDLRATILIRTAFLEDDRLVLQAGATVLLDSDADYEFWECGAKARSMLEEIGHGHLCFGAGEAPAIVSGRVLDAPREAFLEAWPTEPGAGLDLLLVDNEDSFTFNLAALFRGLGCTLRVVRNRHRVEDLDVFDGVLLSPGPSSPTEAGCLLDTVRRCAGTRPVFGVCLGMQAMALGLGGELGRLPRPLHGKRRPLHLVAESRFFEGIEDGIQVARYHSLHAVRVPSPLRVTARDEDGVVLALEGPADWPPFLGVQFHPESFLTGAPGIRLARNWLAALRRY
jgi:anthranilate synthase